MHEKFYKNIRKVLNNSVKYYEGNSIININCTLSICY